MIAIDIHHLLQQAGVVRNACDLDLLVFLWRHPRALMTSDRIAQTLGYTPVQIGSALDRLIEEGLLERAQNPSRAARLYLLVLEGESGEATARLLSLARDPEVRRALLRALDGHGPQPEDTIARGRGSLRIVGRRR